MEVQQLLVSPVMLPRDFWSQPHERIWKGLARKSSTFSTRKGAIEHLWEQSHAAACAKKYLESTQIKFHLLLLFSFDSAVQSEWVRWLLSTFSYLWVQPSFTLSFCLPVILFPPLEVLTPCVFMWVTIMDAIVQNQYFITQILSKLNLNEKVCSLVELMKFYLENMFQSYLNFGEKR